MKGYYNAQLLKAVKRGNFNRVNKLLELGADPEARYNAVYNFKIFSLCYPSVLTLAVAKDSKDIVKLLLEKGAYKEIDRALVVASKISKDGEIVKILMENGARVEPFSKSQDDNPLFVAVDSKNVKAAEQLLIAGYDPNSRFSYEKMPLSMVVVNGDLEMANVLIKHGADPNVKSRITIKTFLEKYTTPILYGIESGNVDMVKLFSTKCTTNQLRNLYAVSIGFRGPRNNSIKKNLKEMLETSKLIESIPYKVKLSQLVPVPPPKLIEPSAPSETEVDICESLPLAPDRKLIAKNDLENKMLRKFNLNLPLAPKHKLNSNKNTKKDRIPTMG